MAYPKPGSNEDLAGQIARYLEWQSTPKTVRQISVHIFGSVLGPSNEAGVRSVLLHPPRGLTFSFESHHLGFRGKILCFTVEGQVPPPPPTDECEGRGPFQDVLMRIFG